MHKGDSFVTILTMLKIRLQRVGRKHDPSFRIVLTDSKNGPKSGKFLEILGNYDPKKDIRKVDGDRVKELIATGAQVSDTVHNILLSEKVIEGKKINVLPKKSPIVDEEKIKAEAEAAEAKKEADSEQSTADSNDEEEKTEEVKEEAPAKADDTPAKADDTPAEEVKEEEVKEETKEEGKPAEEEKKEKE